MSQKHANVFNSITSKIYVTPINAEYRDLGNNQKSFVKLEN